MNSLTDYPSFDKGLEVYKYPLMDLTSSQLNFFTFGWFKFVQGKYPFIE